VSPVDRAAECAADHRNHKSIASKVTSVGIEPNGEAVMTI